MTHRSICLAVIASLAGVGCSFSTEQFTLGSPDTGVRDTGFADLGFGDAGARDVGTTDTGTFDTGALDTGAVDTGALDTGALDTGALDTGALDTGALDTGAVDAGNDVVDAGSADIGADVLPDVPVVMFCATSRPCPSDLVCDDGICAPACPSGQRACEGFCRAVQTDIANCGACNTVCAPGQDCRAGACTTICAAPTTNCSNVCRDLQADNNHCGLCGRACVGGTACVNGACACPAGQTVCGGVCTNLQTDATRCGACTNACAAGQLCANGVCVTTCTAGLTNCSGVCRNLQTDTASCGACGRVCTAPTGGTATCTASGCVLSCPTGRSNCSGVCVDLSADTANCGVCGQACLRTFEACLTGICCLRGATNCSGTCRTLSNDEANCGACGRACASGFTCRVGLCEPNFRVVSMGSTNCRTIDQMNVVGDDRGGIVANNSFVYYSGDLGTGRASSFDLSSFTLVTAAGSNYVDGMLTNVRDGVVYSLSTDGSRPFISTSLGAANFTTLLELNTTTLLPTGRRILLSAPIAFDPAAYGRYGVFSGYDRVVIYNGTRAFNITLPTGVVTDLGTVPVTSPCTCENWAYWGVAEFFADAVWLVYRQLPATGGTASNIVRVRVPDGLTQVVGSFTNLADMCSIAALPARARWYWHHEGPSQFSAFPSGEALGFCDASYAFTN